MAIMRAHSNNNHYRCHNSNTTVQSIETSNRIISKPLRITRQTTRNRRIQVQSSLSYSHRIHNNNKTSADVRHCLKGIHIKSTRSTPFGTVLATATSNDNDTATTASENESTSTNNEVCIADELDSISEQLDIWRDTPVRFLGYANECGEATRQLLPPFGVPLSYAIAIGYVLCDTIDKAVKEWQLSGTCRTDPSQPMRAMRVATTAIDALTWQLLASVFVPGSVIHFIYTISSFALTSALLVFQSEETAAATADTTSSLAVTLSYVPTAIGLLTIPFIVEPIDETIHKVHDMSVRPTLSASIDSFNRFEKKNNGSNDTLQDVLLPGTVTPSTTTTDTDMSIDTLAVLKGTVVLFLTVSFPPVVFKISDFVETFQG